MRHHGWLRILAAVFYLFSGGLVSAADFHCVRAAGKEDCFAMAVSGKIEKGDFARFERYVASMPALQQLYLWSAGGSVGEALKIGRLTRRLSLAVNATKVVTFKDFDKTLDCGTPETPPCCMSACVLIYFGGIEWRTTDRLGLHRPSLADVGSRDLDDIHQTLNDSRLSIREYLDEMEADSTISHQVPEEAHIPRDLCPPGRLAPGQTFSVMTRRGEFHIPAEWINDYCSHRDKEHSASSDEKSGAVKNGNTIFELMMQTPPESIFVRIVQPEYRGEGSPLIYPRTVRDWLHTKCQQAREAERRACFSSALRSQRERGRAKWLEEKNWQDFRVFDRKEMDRIDQMTPNQLEKYVEEDFRWPTASFDYAQRRLQELRSANKAAARDRSN